MASHLPTQAEGGEASSARSRLRLLDAVRGVLVVGMAGFHLCYDLVSIRGIRLGWFSGMPMVVWRWAVAWSFLFLAGVMCSCSRSNLRRALKYLLVALGIFLVTHAARVDVPISFGIIFCMGACTLVQWLLERMRLAPSGVACAVAMACLFVLTMGVPYGWVGSGMGDLWRVGLPRVLYSTEWLSWLGLPGPHFASGDYYPLLPHVFLFLAGSAMGRAWSRAGWPDAVRELGCRPLEFLGRHALEAYVLHQPLLLAVVMLLP